MTRFPFRYLSACAVTLAIFGPNAAAQCSWDSTQVLPLGGATGIDFGASVALDAESLIIGAPLDDEGSAVDVGSIQIHRRSGNTLLNGTRIAGGSVSAASGLAFGTAVGVAGDHAFVGAPGEDQGGAESGAVWILNRVLVFGKPTWTLGPKVKPSNVQVNGGFGSAVDMAPGVLVVGAPGTNEVFVFEEQAGAWKEEAVLTGTGAIGHAVATDGTYTVVGVKGFGARVYKRTAPGTWQLSTQLTPVGAAQGTYAGSSVAVSYPYAALGNPQTIGAEVFSIPGGVGEGSFPLAAGSGLALDGPELAITNWGDDRVDHYRRGATWATEHEVRLSGWSVPVSVDLNGGMVVSGHPLGDRVFRYGTEGSCVTYCTPGTSASGCTAELGSDGVPSASASSGFDLWVTAIEGDKDGLFFFGTGGRQANPWGSGTSSQCVVPPVIRGGLLQGSGTPGLCNGALSQDLNALWCAACPKPAKNPGAGAVVQAQLWYRDPQNTSNQTTSLSNAMEFTVSP